MFCNRQDGQLVKCGNSEEQQQILRLIRGDKITWVAGNEANCPYVTYLVTQVRSQAIQSTVDGAFMPQFLPQFSFNCPALQIDSTICKASAMENNGELGNYVIRERTKVS